MFKKSEYKLKNYKDRLKKLGNRYTDILFFREEISKVECCICIPLKEKLGCNVYWYKSDDEAIVCVPNEFVDEATKCGKQLIIQNFDTMTAQYLKDGDISPVLLDYFTIATIETNDIYGLMSWCHNISEKLIVKTSKYSGYQCIMSKQPFEDNKKLKELYEKFPFGTAINFLF